jgi:hypothetical protein
MSEKPMEIKSIGRSHGLYPIINRLPQFSTNVEIFFHNSNLKISPFFFDFQKILNSENFFVGWNIGGGKGHLRDGFPENWNGVRTLADVAD